MYFEYGEKETDYLAAKDKKLGEAILKIGHVRRKVDEDLFAAVTHQIIGQQISTAALATLWDRLNDRIGKVDAEGILSLGREQLQDVGMSYRKAEYILDFAEKVKSGAFDVEALEQMPDDAVVLELTSLKGVGVWTAEMVMIFCMQRPDVVSFGRFSGGCGCFIGIARSIGRSLINTGNGILRMVPLPVCICGKLQAAH